MFAGTMELRIFDKSFRIPESYRDPGILFVLRGGALVTVGNEKASLDVTDYLVINSYEHFTVETRGFKFDVLNVKNRIIQDVRVVKCEPKEEEEENILTVQTFNSIM